MTTPVPVSRESEEAAILFGKLRAYKEEGERRGIPQVLREIHARQAWRALGCATFDEACDLYLGGWRLALPVEERRELVADLRGDGMSTRAIASIVGIGDATVRRDLDAAAPNDAPAPVRGLDGKIYPAHVTQTTRTTETTKIEQAVNLATGEILGETITAEQWQAENPPIIDELLEHDPDVIAARKRHMLAHYLARAAEPIPDPVEMAQLAPDMADGITRMVERITTWTDAYRAALPTRLHAVKGC